MMFTQVQGDELIRKTATEWVTINNVNGRKFYKYNDPSKYVFLPVAGHWESSGYGLSEKYGEYWSTADVTNEGSAFYIVFNYNSLSLNRQASRLCGFSIRPIAPPRPW